MLTLGGITIEEAVQNYLNEARERDGYDEAYGTLQGNARGFIVLGIAAYCRRGDASRRGRIADVASRLGENGESGRRRRRGNYLNTQRME